MARRVHHRFKVQRRVEISARDRSNRKFLFAEQWRTSAEADHLPVAETMLRGLKVDQPRTIFRIVEVWPTEDREPRVIIPPGSAGGPLGRSR